MERFISLNINRFGSLILSLIDYDNSKCGDNDIEGDKKDCGFKTFKFFGLNEVDEREGAIIISEFKF